MTGKISVYLLCCHANFKETKDEQVFLDDIVEGKDLFSCDFKNECCFYIFHLLQTLFSFLKDKNKKKKIVVSGGKTRVFPGQKIGISESSSFVRLLGLLRFHKNFAKFFDDVEAKTKKGLKLLREYFRNDMSKEIQKYYKLSPDDESFFLNQIAEMRKWVNGLKEEHRDKNPFESLIRNDILVEEYSRDSLENVLFGLTKSFSSISELSSLSEIQLKICSWGFKEQRFTEHVDSVKKLLKKDEAIPQLSVEYIKIGVPPDAIGAMKGDMKTIHSFRKWNYGENGANLLKKIKRDPFFTTERKHRCKFMRDVSSYFDNTSIRHLLDMDEKNAKKWIDSFCEKLVESGWAKQNKKEEEIRELNERILSISCDKRPNLIQ